MTISGPLGNGNTPIQKKTTAPKIIDSSKAEKGGEAEQTSDTADLTASLMNAAFLGALEDSDPLEGAEKIPGMFDLYKVDGKTVMTVKPDQLNKPFFFSANVSKSLGENRLVGSEMGSSQLAEFRKVDDMIQLVALHTENYAEENSPESRFVSDTYADSIISSAPIESGGEEGEDIQFDARVLLYKDIAGYQGRLQATYGTAFQQDLHNTSFSQIDNSDKQTSFGVAAHFESPTVSAGSFPTTTPLANSVLTEFRYNFLKLPEDPMKPRVADERIGHFATTRKNYSDQEGDGQVRYINRWRLEKKDPDAKMSEPKEPITFWIASDVPKEYRKSVREGILEWNKAFEAIGFKDAIKVKTQRSNQKFDTMDARHASVNWYTAADAGSAVGPSQVDPRTGEILDADIRMADLFGRSAKSFFDLNVADKNDVKLDSGLTSSHAHSHGHIHGHTCDHASHAATEHEFASGLLQARGKSGDAKKLAKAYVKDVIMHEVGHTLGLRHNFKASTAFNEEQLQNKSFTKENGLAASVMDYLPFNLAGPGETQGEFVQSTLGAYDYLAIAYAYSEIDPAEEELALNDIAEQTTTNPVLAYESDEAADDMDPEVSRFDIGKNPLSYAKKQVVLANELLERAQTQELPDGESYREFTKAFKSGIRGIAKAARLATRYVGGTHINRVRAGNEDAVYEPVPAEKQREAVGLLMEGLFQPDSFSFEPEFLSRLDQDRHFMWGDQNIHAGEIVSRQQGSALRSLLAPHRAQRMISNLEKLPAGADTYKLGELYQTVQDTVWSELSSGSEISQGRRDLQREYLNAIAPILDPNSSHPGEAKSMMRYLAGRLKKDIDATLEGSMPLEQIAHLNDVSHSLGQMLDPKE